MEKLISINQTVYELSQEFPEIVEILANLGFKDIVKPGMLVSVGRFVTLKQGASLRKIDMHIVKDSLINKGFSFKEKDNE
ncbi:MAG: DUF1858 domain-containing protein [Bacilli bacterium]|jgi:hypothetical protein|nr:DUF1858 domain-containing protein [Bacilli bacterium]